MGVTPWVSDSTFLPFWWLVDSDSRWRPGNSGRRSSALLKIILPSAGVFRSTESAEILAIREGIEVADMDAVVDISPLDLDWILLVAMIDLAWQRKWAGPDLEIKLFLASQTISLVLCYAVTSTLA